MKVLALLLYLCCLSAPCGWCFQASGNPNSEYDQHVKTLTSEVRTWREQIEHMDIKVLGIGYAQGKVIEDSRLSLLKDLSGIEGGLTHDGNRLSDEIGLLAFLGSTAFMAKTFNDNLRIFSGPQGETLTAPWRAQLTKIMDTITAEELFHFTTSSDRADDLESKAKP